MPQFSVIIPTFNRADGRLQRALDSVATQVYQDWECIVIDDGSTDDTDDLFPIHYHTKQGFCYIRQKRRGRVIARNTGMKAAGGEWVCFLDSDDAYDPMYLATVAYHIEEEPGAQLFVLGSIIHGQFGTPNHRTCPAWTKIRRAWVPPVGEDGRHTYFDSGHVGMGQFVFQRDCLEVTGLYPPWKDHDDVADGIDEWLGLEYGTLGYGSGKRKREMEEPPLLRARGLGHVGNPYGEDHCLFLKLALNFQVYPIAAALYVQYTR